MNVMEKIVEVKNLGYTYTDGTQALRGISLDIFRGETIGIIGPNGAGKSTFLLHLNGIVRGKGFISIFGLEPTNSNLAAIREKVGVVFQNPDDQLFMPTVFDDVAFGPLNLGMPPDDVKKSVDKALSRVEMKEAVNKVPHHLSIGEKRKISIATVLSMNPRLLLLDEPSSNLDPHARRNLINLLKGFDITKIIATHDLELVLDVCQRVILLSEGRIVADGDAKAILNNRALLESHRLEIPPSLAQQYFFPVSRSNFSDCNPKDGVTYF